MYRTFNMGIGMLVAVDGDIAEDVIHRFQAHGEEAFVIGEIAPLKGDEKQVELQFQDS